MDVVLAGIQDALNVSTFIYVAIGVFVGLLVGTIPGLSAPMAIALCVPLTYYMPAVAAIGFLIGINKGGFFGGSISATFINTPGTAEAAATALEGYPLAKQGKGVRAIKMALYASAFGDIFSTLLLFAVAGPVAGAALKMGPSEICSLIMLSLTMIAILEAGDLCKGLVAAALGMFISTVGMDPVVGEGRLTLGIYQLEAGIPMIPMCIGLLALSELFAQTEGLFRGFKLSMRKEEGGDISHVFSSKKREDNRVTFKEYIVYWKTLLRSSCLGSIVGALPGLGAAIAAFLAYGVARNSSKHPEEYGHGSLEGIAAAESANNAVVGSSLIPLFTLGIPGNMASAIMIGAFVLHGVTPGPLMFEQHGQMVYGVYATMIVSNIMLLALGLFCIRFFARMLTAPKNILMPIIMLVCMLGAYMAESSTFAVGLMIFFGIVGYIIKKVNFSFICLIVGYILGPMFELSFQQSIISFYHKPELLLHRPITLFLLAMIVAFCVWNSWSSNRKARKAAMAANAA